MPNLFEAQLMGPWRHLEDDPELDGAPSNVPFVSVDYDCQRCQDVSEQPAVNIPTSPNLVAHRVIATASVMTAIRNDDRFHILWLHKLSGPADPADPVEQKPDVEMPDAEWNSLRAHLAGKAVASAEIDNAVGPSKTRKTRRQISDSLRPWLSGLPQGKRQK